MAETNTFTAICGACADEWAYFEEGVTERDASGTPLKGSMGVYFDVQQDLANLLYEECKGNFETLLTKLSGLPHSREKQKGTKDNHDRQLVAFIRLCEGETREFFIKKGTTPLWLVRRVGHYRYNSTKLYRHRVSYEFVRNATEQEQKKHFPKTITPMKSTYGTLATLLG